MGVFWKLSERVSRKGSCFGVTEAELRGAGVGSAGGASCLKEREQEDGELYTVALPQGIFHSFLSRAIVVLAFFLFLFFSSSSLSSIPMASGSRQQAMLRRVKEGTLTQGTLSGCASGVYMLGHKSFTFTCIQW